MTSTHVAVVLARPLNTAVCQRWITHMALVSLHLSVRHWWNLTLGSEWNERAGWPGGVLRTLSEDRQRP